MNSANTTFEQSMARLEQIVRAMERGDVALEESLKLFQEGTELVRSCQKILDAGKQLMVIENALHNGYEQVRPHLGTSPYVCLWANPEDRDRAVKIVEMK